VVARECISKACQPALSIRRPLSSVIENSTPGTVAARARLSDGASTQNAVASASAVIGFVEMTATRWTSAAGWPLRGSFRGD
jgi:hypothetical protein